MNDLRDRALRAAREQAEQRERDAVAKWKRERDRYIADAKALCEQTLGVNVKFTCKRRTNLYEENYSSVEISTVIEGVTVIYYPWGAGSHRLSHDLARLGVDIQAAETAAKESARREVRMASARRARTCKWCGEVVSIRSDTRSASKGFPSDEQNADAMAEHKKRECRKAPWWKRL